MFQLGDYVYYVGDNQSVRASYSGQKLAIAAKDDSTQIAVCSAENGHILVGVPFRELKLTETSSDVLCKPQIINRGDRPLGQAFYG